MADGRNYSYLSVFCILLSLLVVLDGAKLSPRIQNDAEEVLLENVGVDARCELCKFFVQKIKSSLESNKTLGMIYNTINGLCMKYMNASQRAMCPSIAKFAVNAVKAYVDEDFSPKNVCILATFCPANSVNALRIIHDNQRTPIICTLCQQMGKKVHHLINENMGTIHEIAKEICDRMPPPTDKKCEEGVDALLDQLVNVTLAPEHVCKVLGLCSNAEGLEEDRYLMHPNMIPMIIGDEEAV